MAPVFQYIGRSTKNPNMICHVRVDEICSVAESKDCPAALRPGRNAMPEQMSLPFGSVAAALAGGAAALTWDTDAMTSCLFAASWLTAWLWSTTGWLWAASRGWSTADWRGSWSTTHWRWSTAHWLWCTASDWLAAGILVAMTGFGTVG